MPQQMAQWEPSRDADIPWGGPDKIFSVFIDREGVRANMVDAVFALSAAAPEAITAQHGMRELLTTLIAHYSDPEEMDAIDQIAEAADTQLGMLEVDGQFNLTRVVPRAFDGCLMLWLRCFAASEATDCQLQRSALATTRSKKLRAVGKNLFKKGHFADAADIYGYAAELAYAGSEDKVLCHSNRSECFLKLLQPQNALQDTKEALAICPQHSKSLDRQARALTQINAA